MNIPLEEEINKEEEASNDFKEEDLGIQASEEECYKCNQFGHYSTECRKKAPVELLLTEDPRVPEEEPQSPVHNFPVFNKRNSPTPGTSSISPEASSSEEPRRMRNLEDLYDATQQHSIEINGNQLELKQKINSNAASDQQQI
ncbi:hypothetical protein DKX38_019728 [Salix brachista]|uniref:CCHC-type domain-containing protein n=1 Tax=Salix brachista TaxID=2182728 RepID=A0A5N5KH35_9ROSI|nr:hypothetical protein DKX38_019728 [Salix brachista]